MNPATGSTTSRRAFLGRVGVGAAGIAAAAGTARAAESGKPVIAGS